MNFVISYVYFVKLMTNYNNTLHDCCLHVHSETASMLYNFISSSSICTRLCMFIQLYKHIDRIVIMIQYISLITILSHWCQHVLPCCYLTIHILAKRVKELTKASILAKFFVHYSAILWEWNMWHKTNCLTNKV